MAHPKSKALVKFDAPELSVIESSKAEQIKAVFVPMAEMLAEFEERFEDVLAEAQEEITKDVCSDAKVLRIAISKVRIAAEKARKEQKEEYLRAGKAIDGVSNILKWAVTDKENKLKEIEDHFELQETRRLEKLQVERVGKLLKYVEDAEDRNLLPVDGTYYDYSLRKMRMEIAQEFDKTHHYSSTSTILYERLKYLFKIIHNGDKGLKVNMYNGSLFDQEILRNPSYISISDKNLATLLDLLSRDHKDVEQPVWINYADLSVKHLGSIYESLLGFNLKKATCDMGVILVKSVETIMPLNEIENQEILETILSGKIYLTNENSERKSTGSYFTPDYIVRFITEETIGPT
ncbi:hypothetical protein LCGC14_2996900, partial [marine sediment metagenome]